MAEYITKSQAIELAESLRNIAGDTITNAFVKGIEGLEGWVSVKDRLPNSQANVIVAVFWGGFWQTKLGWYSDKNNTWYIDTPHGESETCGVKYWKPISEPSKDESAIRKYLNDEFNKILPLI